MIGQPVRRREDLRLLTGRGPLQRRCQPAGPGLCGHGALAARARAHPLDRHRRGDARRRACSRCSPARDCTADGLKPDPARPWSRHPADIALDNSDGSPTLHPRRIFRCRPTRRASSARSSRWSSPTPLPRPRTAPSWSRSTTSRCRAVTHTPRAAAAGRAARLRRGRAPTSASTRSSATPAATDAAFARAAHVVAVRDLGAARHRRADGAARRDRRHTMPRPAATRSMPAAAARCGRRRDLAIDARRRPTTACAWSCTTSAAISARAARSMPEFALVAWAARRRRPPGEMDLRAQRILPQRLPGARSRGRRRAGARSRRAISWRCAAPTSAISAPTRSPSARCRRASRSCRASTTCRRRISAPAPR